MLDTADSTLVEAYSSLPNAFTTLIPPNCSSTSVVMFASASLTFKDTSSAFEEKFDASQSTNGIDSITIAPNGRLRVKRVMLRMSSKNMLAVARGAIAKASLTCDASLDARAISSPVGTLS